MQHPILLIAKQYATPVTFFPIGVKTLIFKPAGYLWKRALPTGYGQSRLTRNGSRI